MSEQARLSKLVEEYRGLAISQQTFLRSLQLGGCICDVCEKIRLYLAKHDLVLKPGKSLRDVK